MIYLHDIYSVGQTTYGICEPSIPVIRPFYTKSLSLQTAYTLQTAFFLVFIKYNKTKYTCCEQKLTI